MNPMEMTAAEFIEKNHRLVHRVCQKYVPLMDSIKHTTGADYEDLYQIGLMGLLKARERFNPDYGLKLSTYAVPMVIGEIRRFLRDNDFVKTSRWIKDAHNRMKRLELEGESVEVIAAALELDIEKTKIVIDYKPNHRSMSETVYHDDGSNQDVTLEETLYVRGFEDETVNNSIVQEFVATLDDREREVWFLYHTTGLKQKPLSAKFGISQVQVSRILSKIEAKATKFGRTKGYAKV
jgi:RNA polymerase sporulation-specific sigma factor